MSETTIAFAGRVAETSDLCFEVWSYTSDFISEAQSLAMAA